MKSAFGSKRRARKIEVDEEEDTGANNNTPSSSEQVNARKYPTPTSMNPADVEKLADEKSLAVTSSLNPGKKTFKKSSLRQSIAFDDDGEDTAMAGTSKPSFGRSSSMKKKKPASSRLSFGPGEIISGDAAEALEDDETFTPKKAMLGRRIIENNAVKKHTPYTNREEDEERPTYSKDYLNQLKSSTPTAPKNLQSLNVSMEDEEGLDASELEGAMIVDMDEGAGTTSIPTEAEIREKKERRARLAHEKDFISLDDTGDDRRQLSLLPLQKKAETRLVREDEDLGEGFDEFVDDGRVALGKKQERETKRRQKKEMADMIFAAEGEGDSEDDSEAERRAAYEAAQTRAGMDGLHKHSDDVEVTSTQVPSKITPLPVLSECLARLQSTLGSMELELARKRKKLNDSKQEKVEIGSRETEVQELLKQAGARYSALKTDSNGAVGDPKTMLGNGTSPIVVDRGLESFGNTPTIRPDVEDVG